MNIDAIVKTLLPSGEDMEAAETLLEAVQRLGQRRIFGTHPERSNAGDTLPSELIEPAITALDREVRQAIEEVADPEEVGRRWDRIQDFPRREAMIVGIIERRVQVWAAFVAIWDAIEIEWNLLEYAERHDRLNQVGSLIGEYDMALQRPAMLEWLATIAERPYLGNLRARLVGEFAEIPPWFLDGTIEELA